MTNETKQEKPAKWWEENIREALYVLLGKLIKHEVIEEIANQWIENVSQIVKKEYDRGFKNGELKEIENNAVADIKAVRESIVKIKSEVLDELEKWAKKRLGGDWKQHEIMLDLLAEIKKLREEL